MLHSRVFLMCASTLLLLLGGCTTDVERVGFDQVKDLSGNWNDTDSRLVSEAVIRDSLLSGWIERHNETSPKRPSVIIGYIRNLSHEHINIHTFVADLERDFVNSRRVDVVASKEERDEIRQERSDMDLHASDASRKEMGKENGADYMLMGSISSIIDDLEGEQIRFYQVDLTLVDIADNRKVWAGQKKLKKNVKKAKFRY